MWFLNFALSYTLRTPPTRIESAEHARATTPLVGPAEWLEAAGGKEKAPIITHCGGGGRGQKAKDFLEAAGFGNVKNGGGPEDDECWAVFGAI